jgi:hypothetical protein
MRRVGAPVDTTLSTRHQTSSNATGRILKNVITLKAAASGQVQYVADTRHRAQTVAEADGAKFLP